MHRVMRPVWIGPQDLGRASANMRALENALRNWNLGCQSWNRKLNTRRQAFCVNGLIYDKLDRGNTLNHRDRHYIESLFTHHTKGKFPAPRCKTTTDTGSHLYVQWIPWMNIQLRVLRAVTSRVDRVTGRWQLFGLFQSGNFFPTPVLIGFANNTGSRFWMSPRSESPELKNVKLFTPLDTLQGIKTSSSGCRWIFWTNM